MITIENYKKNLTILYIEDDSITQNKLKHILERYFNKIRSERLRLTKSRKAMIEILEDKHLTFKEIQKALANRGFYNVSTIYNNLEFLMDHKA